MMFVSLIDCFQSLNDEYLDEVDRGSMDEEFEEKGIRKYAKLILPHVGLVLLTITYTIIGAFFFFCVENPNGKPPVLLSI